MINYVIWCRKFKLFIIKVDNYYRYIKFRFYYIYVLCIYIYLCICVKKYFCDYLVIRNNVDIELKLIRIVVRIYLLLYIDFVYCFSLILDILWRWWYEGGWDFVLFEEV